MLASLSKKKNLHKDEKLCAGLRLFSSWVMALSLISAPLFSVSAPEATPQMLVAADIKPIVDQMLKLHIQYHKLTPKLFSKIISNYFEAFDPAELYLLQSEIEAYANVNEARLAAQIEAFQKEDYSLFEELDRVIQKSIWRARQWRSQFKNSTNSTKQASKRPNAIQGLQEKWQHLLALSNSEEKIQSLEAREREYLYVSQQGSPLDKSTLTHLKTLHVLKAFASGLDPHSGVFSKQEARGFLQALNPHYSGIGIVLTRENGKWFIRELVPGSSAVESGLVQPGDQLLEVNGQPLQGKDNDLEALQKPVGEKIKVVLDRKGQRIEAELVVAELDGSQERVRCMERTLDGGRRVGYIAMDSFYEGEKPNVSSEADILRAIENFKKTGPLNGLILDLRQNMGGYLGQAVKVVGLFITNGVVVVSKYSDGSVHYYRDTDPSRAFTGPVVILTSSLSASAAEIVAQSLQDYGVAVVVGDRKTFGKGSIQTHTFDGGEAQAYYKVTVGRYYTVSGKSTQLSGVPVDVVVPGPYDRMKIGERYHEDPLQPDSVIPAFADTLSDVQPNDRLSMMEHYLPTLQSKSSRWQAVIPRLRESSQRRLNMFFKDKPYDSCSDQDLWDMQTNEAFEIAQEMIDLK